MKFVVDENLPRGLARWIEGRGYQAAHVFDLVAKGELQEVDLGNDVAIIKYVNGTGSVAVSRDNDFRAHALGHHPHKLIFLTFRNPSKPELFAFFERFFVSSVELLESCERVEMGYEGVKPLNP